jgi:hypothetical protein
VKSKEISVFIVASLILIPFLGYEAFAQENQLMTITTLKENYAAGEPIEVTGLVESKITDFKVTLRVFNPVNNIITIDELEVDND